MKSGKNNNHQLTSLNEAQRDSYEVTKALVRILILLWSLWFVQYDLVICLYLACIFVVTIWIQSPKLFRSKQPRWVPNWLIFVTVLSNFRWWTCLNWPLNLLWVHSKFLILVYAAIDRFSWSETLTTSLFIREVLVKVFGLVFWHQKLDFPWSVDQQAHSCPAIANIYAWSLGFT